ncbi:hypothetical protein CASFOL_001024 [Castilleja foliolosa]|uniref:Translocation protein SEC62 n=1 Tax=Castilleja foliolosa TaxID=1961234 RepID=A0ABD3ELC5_9LAMI
MLICGSGSSNNKNPYAERGLDKFYTLLADLDNKKQKIYTQKGAEDISFVRFVYTNDSKHVKPIVVKVKEKKKKNNNMGLIKKLFKKNSSNLNQANMEVSNYNIGTMSNEEVHKEELSKKTRKKSFKLRQPYFYFLVIVVLVLMFLAMYGRFFAILCTSFGWYMVPTIAEGGSMSSSSSSSSKSG